MSMSRINNHQIHTRLYQRCNPVVGICANANTGGNPQLALFVFTRGGKGFGLGYVFYGHHTRKLPIVSHQ